MKDLKPSRRILIISDAWHPQVNGVVRTLEKTVDALKQWGHEVKVIGPDPTRWTVSTPSYPSIKLELFGTSRIQRVLHEFKPDFIHIATEGTLGWSARHVCLQHKVPFTTSYHTCFPEYFAARAPRWLAHGVRLLAYAVLRRFHAPSSAIMVATASIEKNLRHRKFRRIVRWSRGVDLSLFRSYENRNDVYGAVPRPLLLNVGRVAIEKNLRSFLNLKSGGSKVVIGDGPDLARLKKEYPAVHFLGPMKGERLAQHYAAADLFVFPSKSDTFGLVLLEACAAGLRIAAHPVQGPADIFAGENVGAFAVLDDDLGHAVRRALALSVDPSQPQAFAKNFTWEASTRQFFDHLQAPTPQAIQRITRLRHWLTRRGRHDFSKAVNS